MKIIICFLLLLLPFAGSCQVVAVQFDKEMIAYLGYNYITVAIEGYPHSSIKLSTNNGRIEAAGVKGHYIFIPSRKGDAKIYVKNKTTKGIKLVDSIRIRVRGYPATLSLVGNTSGEIQAKLLYLAIAPTATVEWDGDANFPIIRFNITITRKDSEIFNKTYVGTKENGPRLEDSLSRKIFLTVQNGDKIKIDSVIYEDFDRSECRMDPIELKIKDAEELQKIQYMKESPIDPVTGEEIHRPLRDIPYFR